MRKPFMGSVDSDENTSAASIHVAGVSVRFATDRWVLQDIDLSVIAGEIVALLGPSGCGKSTLLRTIARLISPDSGTVTLQGGNSARRSSDLAYVFQDATLLPWRSVWENVRLPLEIGRRLDSNISSTRLITEALLAVGLMEQDWRKFPRHLSGGMRMRCSLARALVTDPSVLLLDEPFAALDDMLRTRMNELLLELWQARSRTMVFVTHNIAEAIYLSHRIAILGQGKVAAWIENQLPFPRTRQLRSSMEFAQLFGQVSSKLAEVAT